MNIIDAHQHFWKYDPVTHGWISEEMKNIRKDFLPEDLVAVMEKNGVKGSVAVQADQTEAETDFLLDLCSRYDFIKGVVGWIDLQSPRLAERLNYYSQFKALKGFRHILQGEAQRDLSLQQPFLNGISLLAQFDLTYDILILPDQLRYIPALVARFPDQRFVIDHLAKPGIKDGELNGWKKDIEQVAQYDHVSCKLSGMVTEADMTSWKADDFTPYMDVVVNAFGVERIMYGSDWPVCLAAADYTQVINLVRSYFSDFSAEEQQLVFGQNAVNFYQL